MSTFDEIDGAAAVSAAVDDSVVGHLGAKLAPLKNRIAQGPARQAG